MSPLLILTFEIMWECGILFYHLTAQLLRLKDMHK
jgi:hypothetical protein